MQWAEGNRSLRFCPVVLGEYKKAGVGRTRTLFATRKALVSLYVDTPLI